MKKEINNDIQRDDCSFEVSKLLKEKGCECQNGDTAYSEDGLNHIRIMSSFYSEDKYPIQNITHDLALKWVMKNFGIHIVVEKIFRSNSYFYMAYSSDKDKIDFVTDTLKKEPKDYAIYNSQEEATEAALKHILKNLMKK